MLTNFELTGVVIQEVKGMVQMRVQIKTAMNLSRYRWQGFSK